jgi:predicted metal-binding protein
MQSLKPPVSTALVLVCDKCGKRMKADSDENRSRRLVSRLKKMSRELFGKGEVRAALTSCLDICPPDRLSVAIATLDGPPRFFAVKADDLEATSRKVLREIRVGRDPASR